MSLGGDCDHAQVPQPGCKHILPVVLPAWCFPVNQHQRNVSCYMLIQQQQQMQCMSLVPGKEIPLQLLQPSYWMLLLSADVPVRMQQQVKRRPQSCAATSKELWTKLKVEGTTFWLLPQVRTSCTYHKSMQCKFDVLACCKLHLAATGWQEPAAVGQNT